MPVTARLAPDRAALLPLHIFAMKRRLIHGSGSLHLLSNDRSRATMFERALLSLVMASAVEDQPAMVCEESNGKKTVTSDYGDLCLQMRVFA